MISDQALLVSVVVITFNSQNFVIETLESIKNQSYKNIELIISDDASSDDTVKMCEEWLKINVRRFVNTQVISVTKNTGISANCNRGLNIANGFWIKFIAGDDLLLKNCIEKLVDFSLKNSEACVINSKLIGFENFDDFCSIKYYNTNGKIKDFYCKDAKFQFDYFMRGNGMWVVGLFVKKSLLNSINGFTEKYKIIEDYPLFLKITHNFHKIYFLDEYTVLYRKHNRQLSNSNYKMPRYMKVFWQANLDYAFKLISPKYIFNGLINYLFINLMLKDFVHQGLYNRLNVIRVKLSLHSNF